MSTRYVWNRRNNGLSTNGIDYVTFAAGTGATQLTSNTICGYCSTSKRDVSGNAQGAWEPAGSIVPLYYGSFLDTTTYGYFWAKNSGPQMTYYLAPSNSYWQGMASWDPSFAPTNSAGAVRVFEQKGSYNSSDFLSINKFYAYDSPMGTATPISSSSSNAYPTTSGDHQVNGYWYTYQGSDFPDPVLISTSFANFKPGDTVTVSITLGTINYTSGDLAIKYTYQVNRNNSGWTNILTNTTLTSTAYQILDGTTSIQFRVQALDSSDWIGSWVTSNNIGAVEDKKYKVSVIADPSEGGTVSGGGTFIEGVRYIIKAVPNSGWHFIRWTANYLPSNAYYSNAEQGITAGADFADALDRVYTAHFESDLRAYTGVNSKSRMITKQYVGVENKSRKIVKIYVGVDNKSRRIL